MYATGGGLGGMLTSGWRARDMWLDECCYNVVAEYIYFAVLRWLYAKSSENETRKYKLKEVKREVDMR